MWAVPSFFRLISLVLNVGLSFSSCTTSVSVRDLACHMQWSCPAVTTATTFTVQTMIQGAEWQNVSHCIQIISNSCDLSQVFDEFDLYNFVRLELNQGHEKIHLTSQLCDPLKELNASFSPPSLSLFWDNQQLWVEVIFPCAPFAVCQALRKTDEEVNAMSTPTCCPVTDFQQKNTTVTLYNKHNRDDNRSRTKMVEDSPWKLQFFDFTPGQEYCAVAHFDLSPLSNPQCVYIPLSGNPNLSVLAFCGVFIALLVVGFVLRRWWCPCVSTDIRLPKSLMSLQSQDQEDSVVDEPRQADFEEEETIVHLSIISLNNLVPSDPCSFYPHLEGHVDKYYTTVMPPEQFCNENEDANYYSADVETDGVSDCASLTHYPWSRWASLPTLKTGMVCWLGNFLPSEGPGIPLSSVRVAAEQINNMESDCSFKVLPNFYSDGD